MSVNESDEPTERDVDALALEMCRMDRRPDAPAACGIHREQARAVLTSDWYVERIAQARREGAAEALRGVPPLAGDLTRGILDRQDYGYYEGRAWAHGFLTEYVDRAAALRGDA